MKNAPRIGSWLLLLALLSATGGSATDIVLCIAADGHCELERPRQYCCTERSDSSHDGTTGIAAGPSPCGSCTDVAIVLRAFKRGDSDDGVGSDQRPVATRAESDQQSPASPHLTSAGGPGVFATPAPPRSVVLRL